MSINSTGEKYLSTSEGNITPGNTIAVGAVLPILGIIAVTARFYGRKSATFAGFGADDWLILVSLILTIGMGVMMIVGSAEHGLAQPTPQGHGPKGYLTAFDDAVSITTKIFWSFDLVQCLAFGTAKLSVIFFYRRIFRGTVFNIVSIGLAVIVSIWMMGFFFAILFRCGTQFWALWAPLEDLLAHCYTSTPMFQAFTISDVITDVLILAIPIYWTSKLQMSRGRKVAVCAVFLLGGVVVGAGIARLVIFIRQTKNPYLNADGIGHLTTEIWWSMLEMGISIIAACLPTVRPLFGSVIPRRILGSLREVFSLRSQNSSRIFSRKRTATSGESLNSEHVIYQKFSDSASIDRTFSPTDGGANAYAMRDIEAQNGPIQASQASNGKITVTSQVDQEIEKARK